MEQTLKMAQVAAKQEVKRFYFRVVDGGAVMAMVIDKKGNYSQHLSTDETEGDGDGAFGPYRWTAPQAWTETTREHAESMLQFTFTDEVEESSEYSERRTGQNGTDTQDDQME